VGVLLYLFGIINENMGFDYKVFNDEQLVVYIRTKDKEAYREIVKRYEKKLMRYCIYLIKDEIKANDVLQSTFLKAFVNLNGFNKNKKFSTWIYRIAHNEAINEVKKNNKEVQLLENMDFESSEDLDENVFRKERQKKIKECLSRLPILYAEPLTLHYLEEKSYDEISDILRISIGTVGTRINRAKKFMRKLCQKKL
jgi:RNA polymerase sigma-70 factor (ECF subfamily)